MLFVMLFCFILLASYYLFHHGVKQFVNIIMCYDIVPPIFCCRTGELLLASYFLSLH